MSSATIVSLPRPVAMIVSCCILILYYFTVYFGEYLEYPRFCFQSPSSNMACFLPLRKTKRRPKPNEEIFPRQLLSGAKIQDHQSFPHMARCFDVFCIFCIPSLPKKRTEKLRPRRLVSTDSAALDAWSFRLDFQSK